jgi:hypothetical protein
MNVGEIFIALGFDVDDAKLKEFNDKVRGLNADLAKSAAVAAGAVYSIMAFVDGSVKGARALYNFREQTGLSAQELQKWQAAARISDIGMSADETQASIAALAQSLADISMGGGDAGAFGMFGVDIAGKDAFDVLEDLRSMLNVNIERYGVRQTTSLLQRMGLDPRFITLLKLSREEMERYRRELTLSERAQGQLLKLGKATEFFSAKLSLLKSQLVAKMSPYLIEFFENITAATVGAVDGLTAAIDWFVKLKNESPLLATALVALAAALTALFIPFGGIIVVAGGLLAAFNDLGAYLRGEDSWIGWLIEKLEWVKTLMTDLAKMIEPIAAPIGKILNEDVAPAVGGFFNKESGGFWAPGRFMRDMFKDMTGGGDVTRETNFNNTYIITGTAPARDVASEMTKMQQDQLNYAYSDTNNGSVY